VLLQRGWRRCYPPCRQADAASLGQFFPVDGVGEVPPEVRAGLDRLPPCFGGAGSGLNGEGVGAHGRTGSRTGSDPPDELAGGAHAATFVLSSMNFAAVDLR
jgi:hypothetical protein